MKIFQIFNGFCHWETGFRSLEETKDYPPDCIFVEAPDYVHEQWGFDETKEGDERFIHPEPPEGWLYDDETNTFFPVDALPRLLEEAQTRKQNENKMMLAQFLETHPITWTDGKQYGVTMEDQSEIQLNLSQYMIATQMAATLEEAGNPATITPVLQWHAIHEPCSPWTYEDLTALAMAISQFVYPWFNKMNEYKGQIYACTDRKEVDKIEFDYRTEQEIQDEEAERARQEAEWQAYQEAQAAEQEASTDNQSDSDPSTNENDNSSDVE